jgi:hypothetical protein
MSVAPRSTFSDSRTTRDRKVDSTGWSGSLIAVLFASKFGALKVSFKFGVGYISSVNVDQFLDTSIGPDLLRPDGGRTQADPCPGDPFLGVSITDPANQRAAIDLRHDESVITDRYGGYVPESTRRYSPVIASI